MSTYTAYNALAELDKYPAFKNELADLLSAAAELQQIEGNKWMAEMRLIARLKRLGSMINLRSTIEQEEGK